VCESFYARWKRRSSGVIIRKTMLSVPRNMITPRGKISLEEYFREQEELLKACAKRGKLNMGGWAKSSLNTTGSRMKCCKRAQGRGMMCQNGKIYGSKPLLSSRRKRRLQPQRAKRKANGFRKAKMLCREIPVNYYLSSRPSDGLPIMKK